MATAKTGKIHCITCGKDKVAYKCEGCSKHFCFNHLADHRQFLIKQLDETEDKRNLFQQTLIEQISDPQKHSLIEQINQWEKGSINKIQQTANETRQLVIKHANEHFNKIQIKLTYLTEELKQIRQEEDFNELHLNELKQKLKELEDQLNKPSNISIEQEMNSSSFIDKISVLLHHEQSFMPDISINTKWIQNGITVAAGNEKGNEVNQLCGSFGIYVDENQTVYVADALNHRIVEWKKNAKIGRIVAGGKGEGNQNDQLKTPTSVIVDKKNDSLIICDYGNKRVVRWSRQNGTSGEPIISNVACQDLVMDNDGYLYVSDSKKHEVRRWKMDETNGTLLAGSNGKGDRFDQLSNPYHIFVDKDHSVYVSDYDNHRVMKWMKGDKEGIVVAGGQGQGNTLKQLSKPRGILVDQFGTIYVADCHNHRVMRWLKGATEGSVVVGGNGSGKQINQLSCPIGLSFDEENNLYVLDQKNYRVQKFSIEPNAIGNC